MDVLISIVAVLIALSCLATLVFSDIKDRRKRVAADGKSDSNRERAEHSV